MLTRDLLRYRIIDGRVDPRWLKATPAIKTVATDLLEHWRAGIGQHRGDLEDASTPLLHRSRALAVARGLQKLIQDGCTFSDPPSAEHLRHDAFLASAAALTKPAITVDEHRAGIAQGLGMASEALVNKGHPQVDWQ